MTGYCSKYSDSVLSLAHKKPQCLLSQSHGGNDLPFFNCGVDSIASCFGSCPICDSTHGLFVCVCEAEAVSEGVKKRIRDPAYVLYPPSVLSVPELW